MKKSLLAGAILLFLAVTSLVKTDLQASVFSDLWEDVFGEQKNETFQDYRLSSDTRDDFRALHDDFLASQKFWIGDKDSDGITVESERITAKYENEIQKQIDDVSEVNSKLESDIFPATCEVCDYQRYPMQCTTLCPEFR